MYLSSRYAWHQRQSPLIDKQMVLVAELAAVDGIGAGMLSAEGGTLAESTLARSH